MFLHSGITTSDFPIDEVYIRQFDINTFQVNRPDYPYRIKKVPKCRVVKKKKRDRKFALPDI